MSSRRFPGKVLAPFRGQPVIKHVIASIEHALPGIQIVVVTSNEESDQPLVAYLNHCRITVFRGPLDNVFQRFRMCVSQYPCKWILRINADSPLLDFCLLQALAFYHEQDNFDLVTSIFPRTFPKGQNAELIRVSTFMNIDLTQLSPSDQEHVTSIYYRNPTQFRIANVGSGDPYLAQLSLAVDTVEDLQRLEQLTPEEMQKFSYRTLSYSHASIRK